MDNAAKPPKSFGGRWALGIVILTLSFVVMPFLFWNATWFGRPITDAQIAKALADRSHPREIQHVLSQFETRIERGDTSVRKWYPQMVALSKDPIDEIRVTDAWVMGQDNTAPEFHQALLPMLQDPNPMVQRNAALSLVRSFRLTAASGSLKAFSILTIAPVIKSIIAGHWSRLKMFPAISDLMRQARLPSSGSHVRSPPKAVSIASFCARSWL